MNRTTLSKVLAAVTAGAFLFSAHSVEALSIGIDDPLGGGLEVVVGDDVLASGSTIGGNTTTHSDGIGGLGAVHYNGAVGSMLVNVTTGIGQPLIASPGLLHLNSIDVSGGAGTMLVLLSDDLSNYNGPLQFNYGGTTQGTVSFGFANSASEFVSFGATTVLGSHGAGAFSNSGNLFSGPENYDILAALITHENLGQTTSFDYAISTAAVPEPATYALLGAGLFVAAAARRRRRLAA